MTQPHHPTDDIAIEPGRRVRFPVVWGIGRNYADHAAEGSPRGERVTGLEVAALQVLELTPRLVLAMSRQVDLAVLADDRTVALDEDLGVVAVAVGRQFGLDRGERVGQDGRAARRDQGGHRERRC